jgi:prepilin-type N-terminal cleavage/methylation domain-containing protein
MQSRKHGRSGFTLIELLVVISLIAALLALTIGVVFRVMGNQRESNTNTNLRKIHMMLDQQWQAKIDQIKKETPPQIIVEACRNADGSVDEDRARAFHLKMRLRQEFPQNFGEVYSGGSFTLNGQTYNYTGKASYKAALKNPLQPMPNTFVENLPEQQSAAMLVLILSQGGGGATTDPETIATTMLVDYPQQGGGSIKLRVFADSWNHHIAFRRAADDDMQDVLAELNLPPFVGNGNPDPQDPAGRLRIPNWPFRNQLKSYLASPNPQSRPYIIDPFDGLNRGPFAFSAGKNGLFTDSTGAMEQNLDNLYSYRVQQSGKGN